MYRLALSQTPQANWLAVDLADLERRHGDWRAGWVRFERRLSEHGENGVVARMERIAPRWRGQPLDGKRVVVYSELGLGDDIQFVRYFPRFAEGVRRNGGEALLAVRSALHPLIRRFAPDCVALEAHDFERIDYTVGLMSMPLGIGLLPDQVDGRAYLDAAPERIDMWRRMLASDGTNALRVGLVSAGSPTHRRDVQRSIPVDALAPLWRLPDVAFYPVAPGREGDIAAMRSAGAHILALPDYQEHFHDSAAFVSALGDDRPGIALVLGQSGDAAMVRPGAAHSPARAGRLGTRGRARRGGAVGAAHRTSRAGRSAGVRARQPRIAGLAGIDRRHARAVADIERAVDIALRSVLHLHAVAVDLRGLFGSLLEQARQIEAQSRAAAHAIPAIPADAAGAHAERWPGRRPRVRRHGRQILLADDASRRERAVRRQRRRCARSGRARRERGECDGREARTRHALNSFSIQFHSSLLRAPARV
jgi:hypothetical protein